MKRGAFYAVVVIAVGAIGIGGFLLERWVNYHAAGGYEERVHDTIRETVKSECLR